MTNVVWEHGWDLKTEKKNKKNGEMKKLLTFVNNNVSH